MCTRTREQRSTSFQHGLNEIHDVWDRDDQRSRAALQAAEADLRDWLSTQPGVTVYSHGGWASDQWRGDVDGRSFHFRDRPDGWYLEIDLHPTGQFVDAIDGHNDGGTTRYRRRELQEGDIIAAGTSYTEGYGTTVVQRAQFIVNAVRVHLGRQDCAHHPGALDSIGLMLSTDVRWCPGCGTQLKPTSENV